jgi:hypothetical protein
MKIPPFLITAVSLLAFAAAPTPACAETNNLIPNWNFNDRTNPLNTWRIDFPYQGSYVKNVSYVKVSDTVRDGDSPAVELDLPKGVAENEGGKIETAFVKIDPGASYHASVDVMTNDLAAKFFVEVYAVDPTEPGAPSLDRIPARDGLPALVKCYRAVFSDPAVRSKNWFTAKRDFTVPASVTIAGKPSPPVYATIKAFGLAEWAGGAGKVYFSKFVLMKTKG